MSIDDRDVGVAHLRLHLFAQVAQRFAALLQCFRDRNTGNASGRPKEHLRGAVVTNHLRFHLRGIYAEVFPEMDAKALRIEISPRAQHGRVATRVACNICERIGWIGDHQEHCAGLGSHDLRQNLPIDFCVLREQLEPSPWIVAICGTARFFIHSRRDEYNASPFKSIIVAIYDIDFGTKRGAIPNVGRHGFCPLTGPVDQNNLARAAADRGGHRACTAHVASSNYPDLHGCIHLFFVCLTHVLSTEWCTAANWRYVPLTVVSGRSRASTGLALAWSVRQYEIIDRCDAWLTCHDPTVQGRTIAPSYVRFLQGADTSGPGHRDLSATE